MDGWMDGWVDGRMDGRTNGVRRNATLTWIGNKWSSHECDVDGYKN